MPARIWIAGIGELIKMTDIIKALKQAAKIKMTAEEIHKQKISFVFGMTGDKNNITKDKIEKIVLEHEGRT